MGPAIVVWLCSIAGVTLGIFKAAIWSHGIWNAETLGYAFAAIVIPLLISYAIAGRSKVRNPLRFSLSFLGFSLFFVLLQFSSRTPDPRTQVTGMLREEFGAKPGTYDRSSDSPESAFTRDVMHDFIDRVKAHQQETAPLRPDLQALYTSASYATPESMQHSIDAVTNVTALDHDLVVQTEQWPDRVRKKLEQSTFSDSYKQAFWKGYSETFTNSEILSVRKGIDESELRWRDSTVTLYRFALANASHIKVKDAHLIIDDEKIRDQFNDLSKIATADRQIMRESNAQLVKLQNENLSKLGLSRKELGLNEPSSSLH
jgi:hypothetical protein